MIRSTPRPRRRPEGRRQVSPRFDRLEARLVLSSTPPSAVAASAALPVARPMFELEPAAGVSPDADNGPGGGYSPSQITAAYGFNSIKFNGVAGDGSGQTIAIVDAYNDPKIASDLATFDSEFGLPAADLGVVNESGGTTLPAADSTGGWELEESLDVEWAHAIAPGAKIVLVEASSANDSDLLAAVDTASITLKANVVSMSWGGSEFSGETGYDSYFQHAGVAYTVSSGDDGAPISWPAASPNVLAVGGTSLNVNGTTYASESGWSGSGGGPSGDYGQPAYQSGVVTQESTTRANPDVAYDADPSDGFSVYDSDPYNGRTLGWLAVGGTSAGAPQWAGLVAIADQGRAAYGEPAINATSTQEIQTTLYKNASDFHDVTSGSSTGSPSYSAGPGYDYVTGLGSPIANLVVNSLDGTGTTKSADHLVVSGASTDVAGSTYTLTVKAEAPNGAVDPSYAGSVKLTSSDAQATLPGSYTFLPTDDGVHTFTVTLKTAGTRSITATDATTAAASATESGIVVSPAAASQFVLAGLPWTASIGAPVTFTVTAEDPYGNVATGYAGTVKFTSTDAAATLPGSVTFGAANKGVASASITFNTAGTRAVTASDGTHSATSTGVVVSPSGTITLTAAAASTGQINLSWTALKGATGYLVQESANGTSGWTSVASTASAVTTDSVTGLASGTTYYFRVQATGGNGSAFSNVASATTTGTAPVGGGSVSLWPNSYTPSEDYYAYGNYELGVKVETSVPGQVTAIRFFEQTWMSGYTHVGHLWSSNGTLLATATFTNETGYGWQTATLSKPVSIAANSVYVASFSSGGGYFGLNGEFFDTAGVTNGPLQAPANGVDGGNGVYGRGGQFPTVSGNGYNFFADLDFTPTSSGSTVKGGTTGGGSIGTRVSFSAQIPVSVGTSSSQAPATVSVGQAPPKVVVNTRGSWPGRRVASEDLGSSIARDRFGYPI